MLTSRPGTLKVGRLVSLVAVVVLVQASVVASAGPGGRSLPLYAYVTDTKLVLASGQRVIVEYFGNFAETSRSLTWTRDGRYVAAMESVDGTIDTSRLVTVDRGTGEIREFECKGCNSVVPVGDARLMAVQRSQSGHQVDWSILTFDLSSPDPPVSFALEVEWWSEPTLIGGLESRALASMFSTYQGYAEPRHLLLLHDDGTISDLGTAAQSDGGIGLIATTPPSGGTSGRYAVQTVTSLGRVDGADCVSESISIVDAVRETVIVTDVSPITGDNQTEPHRIYMHDLWWREDGSLYGIIESSDCRRDEFEQYIGRSVDVWRWNGSAWTGADRPVPRNELRSTRQLGDGGFAVLADDPSTDEGDSLYLYHSDSGEPTHVSDFVLNLATPPVDVPPSDYLPPQATNSPQVTHQPEASNAEAAKLDIHLLPVSIEEPNFRASGEYPEVSGIPGLGPVNDSIRELVLTDQEATRETAETLGASNNPPLQHVITYSIDTESVSASSEIVSVLFRVSWASDQGAVVNDYWLSLTMLAPSAIKVEFADVFADPARDMPLLADVLKESSRTSNPCLRGAISDSLGPESSIWYDPATYDTFAMTPDGLVVAFGDYEIGPGACGASDVVMPWSELEPILSEHASQWIVALG